jgi:hypothetical protein
MWGHHLENGLQHADDCAIGTVHAFVEPAQAIEVTEELVSAVDEVNDHFGSMKQLLREIRAAFTSQNTPLTPL